jgi:predicted RNase H-like nuclease (RuvC/YqgF family)
MSELRRLREKLKDCYINGFFLDRNTFVKADDAQLVSVARKEDGRVTEKPMVILKNVVEMTVDHEGKIVAVENKPALLVWVDALEHAIERFNK